MSPVSEGQGAAGLSGQTATPPEPAVAAAPPVAGDVGPAGAAESSGAAGALRPRRGGWAAAVTRYGPAVIAGAVMAVLGLWGLARDSSMGNDEVATRWAALLSLRDLAHLLNTIDAVHGLY